MADDRPSWAPESIDLDRPNAARVYDYLLGGAANFETDRVFADKLLEMMPQARPAARANRAFLRRAVRFCVSAGITQFLGIGSGVPTAGNVHEIAPAARVLYVDMPSDRASSVVVRGWTSCSRTAAARGRAGRPARRRRRSGRPPGVRRSREVRRSPCTGVTHPHPGARMSPLRA